MYMLVCSSQVHAMQSRSMNFVEQSCHCFERLFVMRSAKHNISGKSEVAAGNIYSISMHSVDQRS